MGKFKVDMFYLETILHCGMKLAREGTNELSKEDGFDWIALKLIFKVRKVLKGSNWVILLLINKFLQNCSITFFFLCLQLYLFEDGLDQLSRDGFDLMTRQLQVMFNVRNVSIFPFSENSLYYLVVLKSCTKISMVLSHFQGQKVPI